MVEAVFSLALSSAANHNSPARSYYSKQKEQTVLPAKTGTRKGFVRRRKPPKLARELVATRLFITDHVEFAKYAKSEPSNGALLRDLVAEALRARRLRSAGRDETLMAVRDAQQRIVGSELEPLLLKVEALTGAVMENSNRTLEEYAAITTLLQTLDRKLGIVLRGIERLIHGVVFIRGMFWHYIFTCYYRFMCEVDKRLTPERLRDIYERHARQVREQAGGEFALVTEGVYEALSATVGHSLLAESERAQSPP